MNNGDRFAGVQGHYRFARGFGGFYGGDSYSAYCDGTYNYPYGTPYRPYLYAYNYCN